MKTCPACQKRNSDEAVNCSSCGIPFQQSIKPTDLDSSYSKTSGFSPGDLIANRYEVVKELGRGGMGVVYLVKDTLLQNRQEALKMIHPQLVENPQARQRFEQEVGICLDLLHSNIVRVHDLKEWQGQPYFTMEYVSGRSLRQLINDRKDKKPPFSLTEASAIINPLLDALSYAHTFTVHRDVKPENIITTGEFPNLNIKVLDFGIAKTLSPSRFSMTSQMLGTPYYIAPEQTSSSDVDHRADLFAVGVVLYELLTGRMPMGRFRLPSELVGGLSKALDEVVEKSLSPLPEERYANAAEMKNALSRALLEEAKAAEKRQADEAKRRQAEEIKELLSQAQSAMGGRQWERAERLCMRVAGLSPGHPGAAELAKKAAAAKETLAKLDKELEQAESSGDLPRALELCDSLSGLVEDAAKVEERKTRIQDQLQERQRQEEESRQKQEAESVRLREEEEKRKAEEKQLEEKEEAARRREAGKRPGRLFAGLAAVFILVGLLVLWKPWEREPQTGRVVVRSEPPGARFDIGGKFAGTTPAEVKDLPAGSYSITISKDGYEDWSEQVEVKAGTTPELRAALQSKPPPKAGQVIDGPLPGMKFAYIPPGTFMMGSPADEKGRDGDETQHQVALTRGFYLMTTEVTQGQWQAVMGSNPSNFKNCGSDCPVETVSWNDVQEFIKRLNQKEGGSKYRLPTEAEWEYAARAGSTAAFASGGITDTDCGRDPNLDAMGWYCGNAKNTTHPVKQKRPNAWGLYDMHGNVWEWCADWFGNYPSGTVTNPTGPSSGADRVLRGGSWYYSARDCRSAHRSDYDPGFRDFYAGFRLAGQF